MILPIHIYGSPFLTERTNEVNEDSSELQDLINNMIETMHGASGIGLAAPQVGRTERLFVVDLSPLAEEDPDLPLEPLVFINPVIEEEGEEEEEYEEGCLSLPELREYINRPARIKLTFRDRNFNKQTMLATGMLARVIQHELDHLDGVLFIDYISSFKRRLMKRRLRDIKQGKVSTDYPVTIWEEKEV